LIFDRVIHKLKGERFYWDAVYILFSAAHGGFYTVSQKTRYQTLAHNFTKYLWIFKKKID